MQPFVLNRHGRLVFPSNFLPDLDFSVIGSESQLDGVIRRDFETKAPTGTDILNRIQAGGYSSRFELLRDVALNLFWVNRFAFTMYEKQPVRWRDVPRRRDDVFLPIVAPWNDAEIKVAAVATAYQQLPATWNEESEDRIFRELFEVFGHRTHDATDLPSIKPTIAEALAQPESLTFTLLDFDPDHPTHSYEEILDVSDDVPELESLRRWAMVLRNQYPWDHQSVRLKPVGEISDDDVVVLFRPRNREVLRFIGKVKSQQAHGGSTPPAKAFGATAVPEADPVAPYPALDVPHRFLIQPRIAALAVVKGEYTCTQRRSHPQLGVQLVADERAGDHPQDRNRGAALHRPRTRGDLAAGGAVGDGARGSRRRGHRRGAVLLVHERTDDAVRGHLVVRPARVAPDARLG